MQPIDMDSLTTALDERLDIAEGTIGAIMLHVTAIARIVACLF